MDFPRGLQPCIKLGELQLQVKQLAMVVGKAVGQPGNAFVDFLHSAAEKVGSIFELHDSQCFVITFEGTILTQHFPFFFECPFFIVQGINLGLDQFERIPDGQNPLILFAFAQKIGLAGNGYDFNRLIGASDLNRLRIDFGGKIRQKEMIATGLQHQ